MKQLIEKLASRGVEQLTDEELLSLILGDEDLARELYKQCEGQCQKVAKMDVARLRMVGGMGLRRAAQLEASLELGRRVSAQDAEGVDVISSSDDVVRLFRPKLEFLQHEECWVLFLTASNRIIERMRVSQGGIQSTVVDHRLIIKRSLELLATQLILIHNHPSGAATASEQDKVLTQRVVDSAALFDIKVLDHIIISREGDFSFRRADLLS